MPVVVEHHVSVPGVNNSQQVATSTTSAQSGVIVADTQFVDVEVSVLITVTQPTFVRKGANPVALADGTDLYLVANLPYRTTVMPGERLAFILPTGTGVAYITPGA